MIQIRLAVKSRGIYLEYVVFAYTRPFLRAIGHLVGDRTDRVKMPVPWEMWGPKSTFWFSKDRGPADLFSDQAEHRWKYAHYGYRILLPSVLLDFTPPDDYEYQEQSGSGKQPKSAIYHSTIVDELQCFRRTVHTTAAYRQTMNFKGTSLDRYDWYMVDEDVLAIRTDSPLKADEMPKTLQDRACRIARYHDARTGLDANYGAEARVKALYVRKMYEEYEEAAHK
ncbi:hypothetical protein IEO21_05341 [Rhodonia placenta]|uniref:Uncharacterized protein n=1 Tax=Rhodonia placenta TaxID=104341 RepID=A0A8H7P243_9APHY|nr:hypothetical protein IEO21_05341 [Postia placenta]